MNKIFKRVLVWTPRVLGLLFILFVSLFAFDVFEEGYKWWEMALGFFIHMLPSLVMLVALILAWVKKWEWAGAIGYLGFAAWYIGFASGNEFGLATILVLAGIPALIGALFLTDWVLHRHIWG